MRSFSGKVAAITGAGSGIGRALAQQRAGRGCHLALCDVDEKALAETVGVSRRADPPGVKVTSARVDVADREAVYDWAGKVAGEHGRVNLIFNNAGVAFGSTIESADYEDFEWLFGIDFWGVVYGTKAFLPHLKASGRGPHRQHLQRVRPDQRPGPGYVQRRQGCGARHPTRHREEQTPRPDRTGRLRHRRPGAPAARRLPAFGKVALAEVPGLTVLLN